MLEARQKTGRRVVGCLMAVALVTCAAGLHHKRKQEDASVNWQQVSAALMDVENAKRDLHDSLQQRLAQEPK